MTHNYLAEILVPERVQCALSITSIKKAHEHIADLFAQTVPGLLTNKIFDALRARERLGNTGLGHGIALPHCRLANLQYPVGALMTLKEGILDDSPDNEPIDIMFALLIPEDALDEHLQILSHIAERFQDPKFLHLVRQTNQSDALLQLILDYKPYAL